MFALLVDEIMIVTGLVGALVKSSYKVSFCDFLGLSYKTTPKPLSSFSPDSFLLNYTPY